MRLRRVFVGVLVAGFGVGLLMTGQVCAQSVEIGAYLINVMNAQGDSIFNVGPGNDVNIGGTGADTDVHALTSTGAQELYFNTDGGDLYLGGTASAGDLLLYNTGGTAFSVYANGSAGDLNLGGGSVDGDLILKESTTGITTIAADGDLGDLTLGALGTAGDDGDLYLRDEAGVVNNVRVLGSSADIWLGSTSTGDDGDVYLHDGTSTAYSVQLTGSSGSVYNKITGNGLVKGWAQVNGDGTVSSCWRCSTSATNTSKQDTGVYEVDFTIDADITGRPVLCSTGHNDSTINGQDSIACVQRSGDTSTVWVVTRNGAGATADSNFTVLVF